MAAESAAAGADLLQSLRLERKTTPEATAVLLHGEDGTVRVHRMLASVLSPVLQRLVSPVAGMHQPEQCEYPLPSHTVALLDFALDFCCGDPLRVITADNALPLLALADELCMENLRAACEKHLVEDCLVSTNAEQLRVEAERYSANTLLAAVRKAQSAKTSRLSQLSIERGSAQGKLAAAERERAVKSDAVDLLSEKLSVVEMKRAYELEQLFQEKSSRPQQGNPGRDYPHAVEAVVYVRPNCSAPFFTHEGIDLEWVDEDTEQANKRALLARPALDDPPPLDPVQADTEDFHPWPSQPAGGGTATADAEARGLDACAAARSLDGGSPSEAASLPKTYGSIMEAVEAAVPGTVIKLLAGRHLVSQYDRSGAKRWPDFAIRKSLQITGDDGLPRDSVLLSVSSDEEDMLELNGVFTIEKADVHLARLTFTSAVVFGCGAAFASLESKARLWLEDCEVSAVSTTPSKVGMGLLGQVSAGNKRIEKGLRESELGVGVSMCKGTSLNVRDCLFCGLNGAAIQIAPDASKVHLHRSVFTGCGRGSCDAEGQGGSSSTGFLLKGECGAIEVEDARIMDEELREMDRYHAQGELSNLRARVKVTMRDCTVEGNHGPGVSVRHHGDDLDLPVAPEVKELAKQIIKRFSLARCSIKGNELAPGVKIAMRKNKVGWNRTLRGDAFADVAEAFLSDSEYSDEYESEEDYDSDDYTDEDEEDALSDDYVAEQARLFLLTQ